MIRHLDYTARDTDTTSVPKSPTRKPDDEVRPKSEAKPDMSHLRTLSEIHTIYRLIE